ncbi:MAG TPA: DUF4149 domain-containing protein [Thermoanaerobaculales bacterium]|nr:DUF4149 domain-containing protein [Thermoanaerobaculales bacterium]HPA81195.1 DUF4149 domain-containing protein [Thermoanaerobaculales bacterium]HQL29339.1 DUF4149 domain-containing protein [Thermoanaerobaculales bacterium]HQN97595.1 DUF4149 domain-containing protein [Thermoanaerobaculales bacterium]HQP43864.1 DUF4149 domain-containing protein [Thermoanaerobaculales bacterium]
MTSANVVDFLHLLVTAVWIGGMLFMKLVLMPGLQAIDPAQRGRLMGAIARRFTIVAWSSVVVLLVTGILKTQSGFLFSTESGYGQLLLAKHLLFAGMIVIGLVITFAVAPRLKALAPAAGSPPPAALLAAEKRLEVLSAVNTVLGLAVLLVVAVL